MSLNWILCDTKRTCEWEISEFVKMIRFFQCMLLLYLLLSRSD